MNKTIKLKKGLDIKLVGKANKILTDAIVSKTYAIQPPDFESVLPKLLVKPNTKVKAGSVLFYNKNNPKVKFTSPVSGTVLEIKRGERRKVLQVIIEPDNQNQSENFNIKNNIDDYNRNEIIETLLESGLWPMIMQRPYAIIANPDDTPKSIFISGFDSAPLGVDYDFILKDRKNDFKAGIDVLQKLTSKIYLNVDGKKPVPDVYNIKNVIINKIIGKHPAGVVGVQINNIDPVNKGEKVWYINPQDVAIIGKLFLTGDFDLTKIVALAGSEVSDPKYYKTKIGSQIKSIINENLKTKENIRIISGNVLTGRKTACTNYLGFYDSLISVIPEGNYYEFLGWGLPGFKKFSMSRTFFSWLTPKKEYKLDTNLHGGKRAFVISEQYDKVVPMDILPQQLLRACIVEDIDKMEQLGIYEVAEEDFALCDFVCTSKIEVQEIIRKGINLMIKEIG